MNLSNHSRSRRSSLARHVVVVTVVAAFAAFLYAGTSGAGVPTQAADICDESGDGWQPKVNTSGDPASVEVSAPTGYLITAFCAKGGQEKDIVPVDPPQETVTIVVGNNPSVSHYQIKLCWLGPDGGDATNSLNAPPCPEAPPPPPPPPPPGEVTTTPPAPGAPAAAAVTARPVFTG
jgi:hypothetical protein